MFYERERNRVIGILAQYYAPGVEWKDSALLRLYATIKTMRETQYSEPAAAYHEAANRLSAYKFSRLNLSTLSMDAYQGISQALMGISFLDYLTYVVPELVCDPRKTLAVFQKCKPSFGCVEQTHHILKIKLVAAKMMLSESAEKRKKSDKLGIDQLYDVYLEEEKDHILEKEVFEQLYLSIAMFEMRPSELSARQQGAGFEMKHMDSLKDILTDKLQMTRAQQLEMIADFFVRKRQARQILSNKELYNFTACKDEKERIQLTTKALKLIVKIPPLESICAISVHKKNEGKANTDRKTEAQILPNDVMLEAGFVYPMFRQLIGPLEKEGVLLVYPSAHFVRKLWEDETLRDRNITIVMQDENVVALLRYQANENTYAVKFPSCRIMGPKEFGERKQIKDMPYGKIVFFGNHLPVNDQQNEIGTILDAAAFECDVYALLSTYAIEDKTSFNGSGLLHYAKYIRAITIIPQGINNGSFPRRKLWCHFAKENTLEENVPSRIYSFTLNTDLATQALLRSKEKPMEIPRNDFATMEKSIRKSYSEEILSRNATGRMRTMPFAHEITPDIPVWCTRTFPGGQDENPRLEAYVCLPKSDEDAFCDFSERGTIIQSTKKHTTTVSQSDILWWLEKEYPYSCVQQRYSRDERERMKIDKVPNPTVSVREEIIENYLPILENKNIALKTLWYLYPDLRNVYTGSDYNVLSSMMQTVIGQQRVCDFTSELCEKLLMEVYSDLNETALWRNYTILSVAMEKAVRCGYCKANPLADALHEEKLRRKLFAQVRKQLVKKHLNKYQIKKAYGSVIAKLQSGQYAYLGVLLRLLTGLESNIVCALRWSDLYIFEDMDQMAFVIARQVSGDGKKMMGFSDKEDYMFFPLSDGLRELLMDYRQRLKVVSEQEPILCSVMRLCAEGISVDITPAMLNGCVKEILKELNIEDHMIDLAYGENEFRKTNLNKYMGDLMRENFRYWATKEAKLHIDELEYLLRNRVTSTCGRFYSDLEEGASLAIIAAKLDRMECLFAQNTHPRAYRKRKNQITQYSDTVCHQNGYRQNVRIEIENSEAVEFYAYSPRGIVCQLTELVEEGGDIQ